VLESFDPDSVGFDKVDAVFVFSFVLVVIGAGLMFLSEVVWVVMLSMVGMFFGFASMVLCLGLEFD
jgi:hypothetical protein